MSRRARGRRPDRNGWIGRTAGPYPGSSEGALAGGNKLRSRICAVGVGLAAALAGAELALRFLPVQEGLRVLPVDSSSPVLRFAPHRESVWSKGPRFSIVNTVRTNDAGFVNDADYGVASTEPLMAVVGDSYVEAAMVPFAETLNGRLASFAQGRGRVFSFGAAGAGLAQYLVWAEHARDTYGPSAFAFVIIANDFGDALKEKPGHHRFDDSGGAVVLARTDYAPSALRRALRSSALVRYLALNVQLGTRRPASASDGRRWVGNIEARPPEETMIRYRLVTDWFLERLLAATGVAAEHIVLVLDGLRPHLYAEEDLVVAEESAWAELRSYVTERATARGFEVLDLQPRFVELHGREGTRFEFETDNHWNAAGHAVAADAVRGSRVFLTVFPD